MRRKREHPVDESDLPKHEIGFLELPKAQQAKRRRDTAERCRLQALSSAEDDRDATEQTLLSR